MQLATLAAASGVALVASLAAAALAAALGPPRRARLVGGTGPACQAIVQRISILASCPRGPLDWSSVLQLVVFALQITLQEWRFSRQYETEVEAFDVQSPCPGRVSIVWVLGTRGAPARDLPDDAPIALLCPGLNCYAASLPGTSPYSYLLRRPWRVGAFEKRGVGPADGKARRQLRSPVFHLFGHPSDLHAALLRVQARWPRAPIHLVGFSSGNGLVGSYVSLHGRELPSLRSALLLVGGEDYNLAFAPPRRNWLTTLLFDVVLLQATKTRYLFRNEPLLRQRDEDAYRAAQQAGTLQELYDVCMRSFSGYPCAAEAERRINAFSGGCERLQAVPVPFLVVFTEDDPVAPGGPRPGWVSVLQGCESAMLAIYPCGSHLGCYDSWCLTRWVDRLMVQWIDAFAD